MSFFKRKTQNLIPPVESEQKVPSSSPAPSSGSTYVPSRDGDLYGSSGGYDGGRGGGGGGYNSPREKALDPAKAELFSGYNPERAGPNRFTANDRAPELREPAPGEENEEDVEGIKQQIRATKQESVNSTRNALRLAREAEDTARGTLLKLGSQSGAFFFIYWSSLQGSNFVIRIVEKLANTERHLDISKNHALRAEDNTDELKKLNRSIFRPAITFNKDAKRTAKEAKIQARFEADREERERALTDIRDSQNTLGKAATYGRGEGGGRQLTGAQQATRKEQRSRFQFEATASDDEVENELDDNLDEIGDATKRLKALGMAMGQELDTQNQRIDRISDKATHLDGQMFKNTEKASFSYLCPIFLFTPSCSSNASSNPSSHYVLLDVSDFRHYPGRPLTTMDSNTYCLFFLYNLQGCIFTSDHSVTVCNPQLLVKGTIVTETVAPECQLTRNWKAWFRWDLMAPNSFASETYNCVAELYVALKDEEGLYLVYEALPCVTMERADSCMYGNEFDQIKIGILIYLYMLRVS